MRDLEKGTAAAAAKEDEEDFPLIREEEKEDEYSDKNSRSKSNSSSSSIPVVSSRNYKKCNERIMLVLLITVIALITALVPVAQSRITITIATTGSAAADANNNEIMSENKAFKSAEEPTNNTRSADIDSIATTISTNKEEAMLAIKSSETADRVDNEAAIDDMSDNIDATAVASMKDASIAFQTAAESTIDDEANSSNSRMQVDYHTNRFDYSSSWCPNAKCKGTPLCYPCQRRWLIILTTGRSASTTLTEMMARLPGVRMTGENNDLIGRFENLLKDWPKEMILGTMPAWHHNPIPEESWSCATQTLFTIANPPKLENGELLESDETTILGFKTIRLFLNEKKRSGTVPLSETQIQEIAKGKVETLNRLFPCARFVVNFRSDTDSQLASWQQQFGYTNITEASKELSVDNDLLHAVDKLMGPQRSFVLDSTEWTQNITTINQMIDWLGYSPECHFKEALQYNTKNGYAATKTEADLSEDCKYLY